MRDVRLSLLAAVLLYSGGVDVPARGQGYDLSSAALDVCKVLSQPLRYDGQVLTITGKINASEEGSWLVGEECPGVFTTDGYIWPSSIALELPTINRELRLHEPNFAYDWQSAKRVDAKYQRLIRSTSRNCMLFTYTGLFETRTDWSRAKIVYPNGTSKMVGFGHLNGAPAQMLLKSSDDVAPIKNCQESKSAEKKKKKK